VDFSAVRRALGFEGRRGSIPDGAAELYKEYTSAGLTSDDFFKKFTRLPHLEALRARGVLDESFATDHGRWREQFGPASGTPRPREETIETGNRPVDRKIRVVVHDGQGPRRDHAGDRSDNTHRRFAVSAWKPCRKPGGTYRCRKSLSSSRNACLHAESRRAPSNVDQHVVHGTVGTANPAWPRRAPSVRAMPRITPFAERDWES